MHSLPAYQQRPVAPLSHDALIDGGEFGSFRPGPRGLLYKITSQPFAFRYLAATVLFGTFGAGLLAITLMASEGDMAPASEPEYAVRSAKPVPQQAGAARKGDKLVQTRLATATIQKFTAPLTERVGDKEVTRTHGFVRFLTLLPTSNDGFAADIPPLAQVRTVGYNPAEAIPAAAQDVSDAEVTFSERPLPRISALPEHSLSDQDARAQVEDVLSRPDRAGHRPADLSAQPLLRHILKSPASEIPSEASFMMPDNAFNAIDVRISPENLTRLDQTRSGAEPPESQNRDIVLGRGDTLDSVLHANGADGERAKSIEAASSDWARKEIGAGQRLRLLIERSGPHPGIQRVILFDDSGPQEIVAADDEGHFVSVSRTQPDAGAKAPHDDDEADDDPSGITVYQSIYGAALKNGVPRPVIEELIRVFADSIDLQSRASPDDRLGFIFRQDEGARAGPPELLYIALKVGGGETQRLFRYVSPETGEADYFDEQGHSLRQFLLRKPVSEARMSSPFGVRFHPILGYSRPHNGVDWAAPIGTPIMAAGDGEIAFAGPHSGYGNRIEISHAYGYGTTYNHLNAIAPGISAGVHVHHGQLIGYVGKTGLATGPHVHYEMTINGHYVDPIKTKLPPSEELTGAALAEFQQREKQIDGLRQIAVSASASAHI